MVRAAEATSRCNRGRGHLSRSYEKLSRGGRTRSTLRQFLVNEASGRLVLMATAVLAIMPTHLYR
ncbi:hypothetical protein ABIE78_002923 [Sinorhizobium fredii]